MAYLRNTWYVAAWAEEIRAGEILSRRLLDEPIVMFRNSEGQVQALSGICPHRYASLAQGQLVGDMVQCGYHGLGFDASGACVHNPFGAPSKTMKLRPYPLVERYGAAWIWMGDPQKADEQAIPDFSFNDPEHFWVGKEYLNVKAGYELEIDNILDLSHIQFLHPTTLGSGEVSNADYEWKQEGSTIWSNRNVYKEVMAEELSVAMGLVPGAPADRWINVRWDAPSNLVIFAGAVASGRPRSEGSEAPTAHLFTPETATSSHYWFSISFPRAMGPLGEKMAEEQIAYLKVPFQLEDLPMLEAQQRNLGASDLRSAKLGWLPGDAAGAKARTILYRMIDDEASATATPPEPAAETMLTA